MVLKFTNDQNWLDSSTTWILLETFILLKKLNYIPDIFIVLELHLHSEKRLISQYKKISK